MSRIINVSELIDDISKHNWRDWLFIDMCHEVELESKCSVLNIDDLDEGEDTPQFAKNNKLSLYLCIADVQDILDRYKSSRRDINKGKLLEALKYYYKNDAFIE